ncbi:hypothetical protein VQ045_19895, partial [Aurantimonas sp. E1-2-R+4]|uniref:hypothetical protein n=1 Tax=Aurantimonas sp. E1-2-R+4 TaxID=3113714 RepID=UPI002F943656
SSPPSAKGTKAITGGVLLRPTARYPAASVVDFCTGALNLVVIERLDPDMANRMRGLLDAKEAENLALVETTYDQEAARQEAFGLTAAVTAYDETCDAMESGLMDLLAYRCETLAEERARARYLLENPTVGDMALMDSSFGAPFLHAVAGIEWEAS